MTINNNKLLFIVIGSQLTHVGTSDLEAWGVKILWQISIRTLVWRMTEFGAVT